MKTYVVGDKVWMRHWSGRGAAKGVVVAVGEDGRYDVRVNGKLTIVSADRLKPR